MDTDSAAKRAANNKDTLPSEKWLAAFAYKIPLQLWGLGDRSKEIIVPRCPVCGEQHLYSAEPGRRAVDCQKRGAGRFLLAPAGPLPKAFWPTFRR